MFTEYQTASAQNPYSLQKQMSNFAGEMSGRHDLKYIIKVNIMNNETNQNHVPPGRNIISFL